LAVKTTVIVSEWLNEPDMPTEKVDIDRMDPLDCASARYGRPFPSRIVAPLSLVSRMVRKSIGMTTAAVHSAESLTWTSRSARLPPAIALALALAEE
jgi:hypothetical protein